MGGGARVSGGGEGGYWFGACVCMCAGCGCACLLSRPLASVPWRCPLPPAALTTACNPALPWLSNNKGDPTKAVPGGSRYFQLTPGICPCCSMLASNTDNRRPPGDADYCARMRGRSPKETRSVWLEGGCWQLQCLQPASFAARCRHAMSPAVVCCPARCGGMLWCAVMPAALMCCSFDRLLPCPAVWCRWEFEDDSV